MPRGCCRRVLEACCPFRRRRGYSSPTNGHDMSLNVILYGECGVGKTSVMNRWVDGAFTGDVVPTFGVDFNIKTLELVEVDEGDTEGDTNAEKHRQGGVDGQTSSSVQSTGAAERSSRQVSSAGLQVKINVYDTSGRSGYREVNNTYLLAFDAVLFVYDISAVSTLDALRRFFANPDYSEKLAARKRAGAAMLLVGNKCDVPVSNRQVGSQTGQDTADEFGIPFMEVSAKSGAGVKDAFMAVATKVVGKRLAQESLASGRGKAAGRRTMRRVPGVQSMLRARASVMDLFAGMTRQRRFVAKQVSSSQEQSQHRRPRPSGNVETASTRYGVVRGITSGAEEEEPLRPLHPSTPSEGAADARGAGLMLPSNVDVRAATGLSSSSGPQSLRRSPAPREEPPRGRRRSRPPSGRGGDVSRVGSPSTAAAAAAAGRRDEGTAGVIKRQEPLPTIRSRSTGRSSRSSPSLDSSLGQTSAVRKKSHTVTPPRINMSRTVTGRSRAALKSSARHSPISSIRPTSSLEDTSASPWASRPGATSLSILTADSRRSRSPSPLRRVKMPCSPRAWLNPEDCQQDGKRVGNGDRGSSSEPASGDLGSTRAVGGLDRSVHGQRYGTGKGSPGSQEGISVSKVPPSTLSGGQELTTSPEEKSKKATAPRESAARRLREASSFWLDKWGIKAAKTDHSRGRHARIRGSSPPPAR